VAAEFGYEVKKGSFNEVEFLQPVVVDEGRRTTRPPL
jgi:hypothetical protein